MQIHAVWNHSLANKEEKITMNAVQVCGERRNQDTALDQLHNVWQLKFKYQKRHIDVTVYSYITYTACNITVDEPSHCSKTAA